MQGKQNGLSSSSNYSISSPEIGEVKWFGKTNIKHYAVMLYKIHLKVWRGKKKKKGDAHLWKHTEHCFFLKE